MVKLIAYEHEALRIILYISRFGGNTVSPVPIVR